MLPAFLCRLFHIENVLFFKDDIVQTNKRWIMVYLEVLILGKKCGTNTWCSEMTFSFRHLFEFFVRSECVVDQSSSRSKDQQLNWWKEFGIGLNRVIYRSLLILRNCYTKYCHLFAKIMHWFALWPLTGDLFVSCSPLSPGTGNRFDARM